MTSTGETSPAKTTTPLAPFLMALTTSLTPLLSTFSLLRCLTSLRILFLSESFAKGLAIGELQKFYVCSLSMLIDVLIILQIISMEPLKQPSIYMRFHVTLQKAISFIRNLYGQATLPNSDLTRLQLALKIAGLTQQIQCQDYLDYHLTWLTGVLCETLQFNQQIFRNQIQNILADLQDVESKKIQKYIQLLTYERKLSKGQRYKNILDRAGEMDAICCYIMIFKLYWICENMRERRYKLAKQDVQGFQAFCYLFWYRAISKHIVIGKNIKNYIKQFFKQLDKELGGMSQARKKAEIFFKS